MGITTQSDVDSGGQRFFPWWKEADRADRVSHRDV